ncbi:unnamed protein product [Colias eurytheme]|nr:unnamed protein product [Colias eurytheme]
MCRRNNFILYESFVKVARKEKKKQEEKQNRTSRRHLHDIYPGQSQLLLHRPPPSSIFFIKTLIQWPLKLFNN